MNLNKTLKENPAINRLLGKVEIDTIIKRIQKRKLSQVERNYLSRSIRPKLIGAEILTNEKILDKIKRPEKEITRNQVIFSLSKYEYNLITLYPLSNYKIIKIEHLIGNILTKFAEPRLIEAIPILFIKNKINEYKLLEISIDKGIKNQIGYLLETSFLIAEKFKLTKKISYLKPLLDYLRIEKDRNIEILGMETDPDYSDFLKETSPKRIKEWFLLGRYFDDEFIKTGGKNL